MVRKKEHDRDLRNLDMKSAMAEHSHSLDHRINFDKFCVIDREKNWHRRRIKESIHILKNDSFNRQTASTKNQSDRRQMEEFAAPLL